MNAVWDKVLDPGRVFLIAEAGVNHNGDTETALRLAAAAAEAGADAVKFQTFDPDRLAAAGAPKAAYQETEGPPGEDQREMLRRLVLDRRAHEALAAECRRLGIVFLSTPFDEGSADLLEALDVPLYKIPSGEITNIPLVRHVAAKGRPLILSTGMAGIGEIAEALDAVEGTGNRDYMLLHCVSLYPTPPERACLRAMTHLEETFGVPVGFSDHTEGILVAAAAAALGARVIEKHLTLDKGMEGPDHKCSLDAGEWRRLTEAVRTVEAALGRPEKVPSAEELETARAVRRSLTAARPIAAGETIIEEAMALKRPGTGLPPAMLAAVLGRRARRDIAADEILTMEMME